EFLHFAQGGVLIRASCNQEYGSMQFGNRFGRLQYRGVESQARLHVPSEHWSQELSDGSKAHDKTICNRVIESRIHRFKYHGVGGSPSASKNCCHSSQRNANNANALLRRPAPQVLERSSCIERLKIAECDASPRTLAVALKIEKKNRKAMPI